MCSLPDSLTCRVCKQNLPITSEFFPRDNSRPTGFRNICKVCKSKKAKAYYEKAGQGRRDYANKYRKENLISSRLKKLAWRAKNVDYLKEFEQRRHLLRSGQLQAASEFQFTTQPQGSYKNTITPNDIQKLLQQQHYRCWWCHVEVKGYDFHFDHIIPFAKGGTNSISNICISCKKCNASKAARMPWDFAGRLF